MRIIHVEELQTSGFTPSVASVQQIIVSDAPLGRGGFGAVYPCLSINGVPPTEPLVVKLFEDNGLGSASQCLDTVRKLQKKIVSKNNDLRQHGRPLLDQQPGLRALPQFSFQGILDQVAVCGFVAARLDTLGYVSFETIFEDPVLQREYGSLTFDERLDLAADLVSALQSLWELSFIHADLNPQNLLVNLALRRLEVIDFDSGAVTENAGDTPSTWGKLNDWLAPEILRQWGQSRGAIRAVKVDRFTDAWAVGIGIHQLLFLFHPLFFLVDLGESTVREYLARYDWPAIDQGYRAYNPANDAIYGAYLDDLRGLPSGLVEKMRMLIVRGFEDPALRPSYHQWAIVLRAAQLPPVIHYFRAEPNTIIAGTPVRLEWSVDGARVVYIDNGIGQVASSGSLLVCPNQNHTYHLQAKGRHGTTWAGPISIRVWEPPSIRALLVPTPTLRTSFQFRWIRIEPQLLILHLDQHHLITIDRRLARHFSSPRTANSLGPTTAGSSLPGWGAVVRQLFARLSEEIRRRWGSNS